MCGVLCESAMSSFLGVLVEFMVVVEMMGVGAGIAYPRTCAGCSHIISSRKCDAKIKASSAFPVRLCFVTLGDWSLVPSSERKVSLVWLCDGFATSCANYFYHGLTSALLV